MNLQFSIFNSIVLCVIILSNFITSPIIVQAQDIGIVNRYLDKETASRGYPVKSADEKFTLLVLPKLFQKEVKVELKNFTQDKYAAMAYQFRITQEKKVPLLKRPLTVVFNLKEKNNYKYKRMYYYHKQGNIWLALSAHLDKDRNLLISNKIDFAQGIIGLFVDNTPLADRIEAKIPDDAPPNLKTDPFTITLGNDIISKGYTINQQGVKLAVLPHVLNTATKVKLNFQNGILDYNFEPVGPLDKYASDNTILSKGKNLLITLPVEANNHNDKTIAFWDNNKQAWRNLPSFYNYQNQTIRAKSPFHFGKYKVINKPGIFIGKASWFRDSLISKTHLAAASNDYPIGTKIQVINLKNNKSVEVEILSTGPFVDGRIIDLTRSAFAKIANPRQGVIEVKVEAI